MIQLNPDITKYLQIGGILLVVLVSIAFSYNRQFFRTTRGVEVLIDNTHENYFVEREEITELMNGGERDYVTGAFLSDIDLRQLEDNIEKHPYVENAQVYRDLTGVVSVKVEQKRPIARIFKREGKDYYISEGAEIINESEKYTARVLLIEMEDGTLIGNTHMDETEYGIQLFALLERIYEDEFWRAQVAGMTIDKTGEIVLQPQITKQLIDFGHPEEIEEKLKKLETFYKRILPVKGWNTYDRVSIKYENQIICE